MLPESNDPTYWRKKAAEFHWRAHNVAPEHAEILTKRAAEFSAMATLLQAPEGSQHRAPCLARAWRAGLAAGIAAGLIAFVAAAWSAANQRSIATAMPPAAPAADGPSAAPAIQPVSAPGPAREEDATRDTAQGGSTTLASAAIAGPAIIAQPAPAPKPRPARVRVATHTAPRRAAARHEPVTTVMIFGHRFVVSPPTELDPRHSR